MMANSRYPRSIDVVVGGQFGSEAKGHVTKRVIANYLFGLHGGAPVTNVRVAGPNAGHTVVTGDGKSLALRQIPVGVVFPEVLLHIAAGSEVDVQVLKSEIRRVQAMGLSVYNRLSIHEEATILTFDHVAEEAGMHERMGSTGKGIGAARASRVMRKAKRVKDDFALIDWLEDEAGASVISSVEEQQYRYSGHRVVVEGTQGFGLGLHAGFYPQCTSSDCRAVDFLAMANLDPTYVGNNSYTPWVVVRPFPIRVAGESGPLRDETSWEDLGLPEERTTVTLKVRRVGHWDRELVRRALIANGPLSQVALTMFDQVVPAAKGVSREQSEAYPEDWTMEFNERAMEFARDFMDLAPLRLVTTSPDTAVWL